MSDLILDYELAIRLAFFFGVFFLMAAWEWGDPAAPPRLYAAGALAGGISVL